LCNNRAKIKRRLANDSFKDVKRICENILYIKTAMTAEIVASNCPAKFGTINQNPAAITSTMTYSAT
jgi:hypothetical protein